jgi:hypothetical protein
VGLTALYLEHPSENDALLRASKADWISPLTDASGVRNIAAAEGAKISLLDSDHWLVKELYDDSAFGREWVWKAFCRGYQPILMEHLPPLSFVDSDYPLTTDDAGYVASRRAMGHTRRFAERLTLAAMVPCNDLSSTHYCLANHGKEYMVYQPEPEQSFSVDLKLGRYRFEWFDVVQGETTRAGHFNSSGGSRWFEPLSAGEAVLHLKAVNDSKTENLIKRD